MGRKRQLNTTVKDTKERIKKFVETLDTHFNPYESVLSALHKIG